MDLDRQLLSSLLHEINWGPLNHAQLMSCNIAIQKCVELNRPLCGFFIIEEDYTTAAVSPWST